MPRWLKVGSLVFIILSTTYVAFRMAIPSEVIPEPLSPAEYKKWHRYATRMWEGPLGKGSEARHVGTGLQLWLSYLPDLKDLKPDGIRLVSPQIGQWYVVAMTLSPGRKYAEGLLVIVDTRQPDRHKVTRRPFKMPAWEYRNVMVRFDALADNWPGSDGDEPHGDGCDYERVRGERITSGSDIFGAQYEKMQVAVLSAVSTRAGVPYTPSTRGSNPIYSK